MSKFAVLYKNYYKWTGRPIFNNVCRSSDINQSSRRLSTNTSCTHSLNEKDEHENEIANADHCNQELDILKRRNLEDFVKIVDKFQKAKLADLQKVLILAQRLQANYQHLKDENLVFKIDDLNKIHLTRLDRTSTPPSLLSLPQDETENTSHSESFIKSVAEDPQLTTTEMLKKKPHVKALSKAQRDLQAKQVIQKMEQKEAMLVNDVKSYLDLCILNGMLNRAYTFLTNCYLNEKTKQTVQTNVIRNVKPYVDLMNAWAKKGNHEAIQKLYMQITDLKLKPNYGVFAAIFECLGRAEKIDTNLVKHYLREAQKNGLNMEEIFSERIYTNPEKKYVLTAISPMLPNLSLKPMQLVHDYDCSLVNHLNNSPILSNPMSNFMSKEEVNSRLDRLLEMEVLDQVKVKSIVPQNELKASVHVARAQLNKHREEWKRALSESFNTTISILEKCSAQMNSGTSLYPYMKLWNSDIYVGFMMQEIEVMGQYLTSYCPPTHLLQYILGQKVYNRFLVQSKVKKLRQLLPTYREYVEKLLQNDLSINPRKLWNEISLANSYNPSLPEGWSYERKKEIGKLLYDIIMMSVKVQKPSNGETANSNNWNIAAFYTRQVMKKDLPQEEVVAHPIMRMLYKDAELPEMMFSPTELPMLLPPLPWTTYNHGGCLLNSVPLIKNDGLCKDQVELIKSLPDQKLFPVYDGINVLSTCPWRVNTWVLDLVIKIFLEGGSKDLNIPKKYSGLKKVKINSSMSDEEKIAVKRYNDKVMKEDNECYSIWMAELYRLSIANQFRNDSFWLSHSVDFRGRAYPCQPHFNHFGTDLARSLLEFGVGKPLGPKGLDWLKIHLINLTGFMKKKSNEEKLAYANKITSTIEDSADRPLDGEKWWQTSDKPWETLSCCKEIVGAMRSPDPEKFISHLPVHQDGSCNGLQHYAALGRDSKGAKSVSLAPSDRPQDVYSDVVDIIEKERIKDAEEGVEIAKSLEGFVRRKVVKQTIMTTVYGVTHIGAMEQIEGQLKDIEEFPRDLLDEGRIYLTDKTFKSLESLFTSAEQIQNWFLDITSIIVHKEQKVSWITPIGWPVLQPYEKMRRLKNGKQVILPDKKKQNNAFAPNFIHSLDSTHMLLTAIHCHRAGVMFASIHDCFWTHAGDIPRMNEICREQFVALHKEPILENLSKHFIETLGSKDSDAKSNLKAYQVIRQIPKKGDFNIDEVKDSTYFFS